MSSLKQGRKLGEKGFVTMELFFFIAIVAILASIIVPLIYRLGGPDGIKVSVGIGASLFFAFPLDWLMRRIKKKTPRVIIRVLVFVTILFLGVFFYEYYRQFLIHLGDFTINGLMALFGIYCVVIFMGWTLLEFLPSLSKKKLKALPKASKFGELGIGDYFIYYVAASPNTGPCPIFCKFSDTHAHTCNLLGERESHCQFIPSEEVFKLEMSKAELKKLVELGIINGRIAVVSQVIEGE